MWRKDTNFFRVCQNRNRKDNIDVYQRCINVTLNVIFVRYMQKWMCQKKILYISTKVTTMAEAPYLGASES